MNFDQLFIYAILLLLALLLIHVSIDKNMLHISATNSSLE